MISISALFLSRWRMRPIKKEVSEKLGKEYFVDKSLKEPIDSDNEDYIMRKIREDYLSDSYVTIFLIGQHSAENSEDDQTYIKRELQASLYNGENNTRSGILGVVLPNMYNSVYAGKMVIGMNLLIKLKIC